jgi:hypothetical protein
MKSYKLASFNPVSDFTHLGFIMEVGLPAFPVVAADTAFCNCDTPRCFLLMKQGSI